MDVRSAELTKYAANAMLATRISFMNELSRLSERVGADIDNIRKGIGSDPRIGSHFLYAGCGYGGSCFPKDVQALLHTAQENGCDFSVLQGVDLANTWQKKILFQKVQKRFGEDLRGKRIAIWGLSFKPDTDDMREAPSIDLIQSLVSAGADVCAYDPVSSAEAKRVFGDCAGLTYAVGAMQAAEGAEALIIVTEWKEFRSPDLERLYGIMENPIIFDGRNILEPAIVRASGFEYYGIGRL